MCRFGVLPETLDTPELVAPLGHKRKGDLEMRRIITMLAVLALCVSAGQAALVLQDDFEDGTMDPAKWSSRVWLPGGAGSVPYDSSDENGGKFHLDETRVSLETVMSIQPSVANPLNIEFDYTLENQVTELQRHEMIVITRSNGNLSVRSDAGSSAPREDGVSFAVEYNPRLFTEATIHTFIKYFRNTLSSILENPEKRLSEIIVFSEEKKQERYQFLSLEDLRKNH